MMEEIPSLKFRLLRLVDSKEITKRDLTDFLGLVIDVLEDQQRIITNLKYGETE